MDECVCFQYSGYQESLYSLWKHSFPYLKLIVFLAPLRAMIIFSKQAKVALTQLSYPDKQKSSQTYFLCYFCVSEFIIHFHKNIITMPHHFRVLLLIIIPKIRGKSRKKGTMKEERNKNRQNEGNQMVTCKQKYVFHSIIFIPKLICNRLPLGYHGTE